jgi:ADP-ribose pyrophosphatase YjhB (NUDIX family)
VEFYKGHSKYLLAVDCVILGYESDELKLLLYPRGFEPVKGQWSLMGGFVSESESCEEAACRILYQTTGLKDIFLQEVGVFSDPGRESFTRVISVAYFALIRIHKHDLELVREHGAQWYPISELPELIFDHEQMIREAIARLQQKAGFSLVGSELLPEKFTLVQLRKLYEAIYQREFDAGNFRKKMLSLELLEKTQEKDFSESRKGAYFYTIHKDVKEIDTGRIVKM